MPFVRLRSRPRAFCPPVAHKPLRLEQLEDRSVPATFNVTTTLDVIDPIDGKRSLREAITAANNLPGADLIVLPAGIYQITIAGSDEDANATGDFDINGPVTIRGAGAGATLIGGQRLDRVFDAIGNAPAPISVVMEGCWVRNGSVTGSGGGIRVGNANLVLRDCIVAGNRASVDGGGVSNVLGQVGNVTVVRTTLASNAAGNFGGAVAVRGADIGNKLTVRSSVVRRNIAASNGGGVFAATATLTNTTVGGNYANGVGGGLFLSTVMMFSCTVSGNSAEDDGGGIGAVGTATFEACSVRGNFSNSDGGGIWASTVVLEGSTVDDNAATSIGGGLFAQNDAHLTSCTVSGNAAASSGGIRTENTATFITSKIVNNTTAGGGGGISATSAAILTRCTVSGNIAAIGGGIITANATLTDCTVSDNSAGLRGGGLSATTATLTNSTFSGNSSGGDGGGILVDTATLLNCTVVENIASLGGGIAHGVNGTLTLRNTLVSLNLVGLNETGPDVSGSFSSGGNNLIGDGSGSTGFIDGFNGDNVGDSNNPIDPKIGPLANNGGPTKTHALLAGSRAIDRGNNAGLPPTDQRGLPRRKDGNGDGLAIVDIGAFER